MHGTRLLHFLFLLCMESDALYITTHLRCMRYKLRTDAAFMIIYVKAYMQWRNYSKIRKGHSLPAPFPFLPFLKPFPSFPFHSRRSGEALRVSNQVTHGSVGLINASLCT